VVGVTQKCWTRLKKRAKGKHPSLFAVIIIEEGKKVHNFGTKVSSGLVIFRAVSMALSKAMVS
jgi:hypothetical protein